LRCGLLRPASVSSTVVGGKPVIRTMSGCGSFLNAGRIFVWFSVCPKGCSTATAFLSTALCGAGASPARLFIC
jgi:hypothetical protein